MSNIVPYSFDGANVRVIEISGETHFVGKDVADALGYVDTNNAVKQHCRGVAKHHPIPDALGRMQETRIISESDMLRLIVNSALPAAERFERWVFEEVLPSIRKTGSYTAKSARLQTLSRNQVAAGILLLRSAAEDLNLAPSAVLGGYQRLQEQLGVVGLLPAYSVDAPASSAGGSSEVTKSATELLKEFGARIRPSEFNKLLEKHGFLREEKRPTSKGGTKAFKVCTNMEFGKNLTNPKNQRETQPHWYVSKFTALLDLVLPGRGPNPQGALL